VIFVEPHACWEDRTIEQRRHAEAEAQKRCLRRLHPIEADLMYLVNTHNEPEINKMTLAHAFAKIPACRNRQERDNWILRALHFIQNLIRIGKLEWGNRRNHVRPAPPEKHEAYLARMEGNLARTRHTK
jgi:hypothetical protein